MLESSIEEYDRLGRMLESLLFLARSDNADLPLERKRIALGNELAAICEFFDAVAAEKQVALSYMGSGDLMADPMLFRRAVVNRSPTHCAIRRRAGASASKQRVSRTAPFMCALSTRVPASRRST